MTLFGKDKLNPFWSPYSINADAKTRSTSCFSYVLGSFAEFERTTQRERQRCESALKKPRRQKEKRGSGQSAHPERARCFFQQDRWATRV